MPETGPYDQISYPANAFDQTHPDRLATIASLFGMRPALPSRCRVLEFGCGLGANLLPMARQLPASEFLGIDLSAPAIARGREAIEALGLKNLTLRAGDILEIGDNLGQFDYIIAHGVYSWVPPQVREKMLTIFGENLAPQGVVYVSFNAYPGSHLRDIARTLMLYHTRGVENAGKQIAQGRKLLRFLAESADSKELYGAALREACARIEEKSDQVLYHDELAPFCSPFLLSQIVGAASANGLQFLSEATFPHSTHAAMPEHTRPLMAQIPGDRLVEREQYFDFLVGRSFREILLCHADIPLRTEIDPQIVRGFYLSANLRAASGACDLSSDPEEFLNERGDSITVTRPLTKAALLHLGSIWPQAIAFDALAEAAEKRVAADGLDLAQEAASLAATLYRAHCIAQVELHVEPPRLVTQSGERPTASVVARQQARGGRRVTNLRHANIEIEDTVAHQLLLLADGTRSMDDLAAALDRLHPSSGEPRQRADEALRGLGRLALMEA